jgi:ribosomal protein L18
MAIEDNLDQLYALFVANSIMNARLWTYLAAELAKSEGITEEEFLARQAQMSIESVDLWDLHGHHNTKRIRQMAKAVIDTGFRSSVKGAQRREEPRRG